MFPETTIFFFYALAELVGHCAFFDQILRTIIAFGTNDQLSRVIRDLNSWRPEQYLPTTGLQIQVAINRRYGLLVQ